jgi:predicted PurR-regulated permease PerM
MQFRSFNAIFFFVIFAAAGTAVFFVFQPFLTAMVAAAVLTVLLKRPYHFLEKLFHGKKVLSALLTCLFAIFIIVTPLAGVTLLTISEVNKLSSHLSDEQGMQKALDVVYQKAEATPMLSKLVDRKTFSEEKFLKDLKGITSNLFGFAQKAYASISAFVLWIFVLFFTLFYFLIDGKKALRYIIDLSPLKDKHDKLLIQKFTSISRATIKGTFVVGIIQSVLGGMAFVIAGIPSPVIWTLVMLLFSVIPMVGTAIIWVPAGVILLAMGYIWQGVFILAFGTFVIATIDNILRPKLVGKDTQMHPLLIFFATLGGIAMFGLPGFVIGPIIISFFVALAEIYHSEFREQLKEYNE